MLLVRPSYVDAVRVIARIARRQYHNQLQWTNTVDATCATVLIDAN